MQTHFFARPDQARLNLKIGFVGPPPRVVRLEVFLKVRQGVPDAVHLALFPLPDTLFLLCRRQRRKISHRRQFGTFHVQGFPVPFIAL